jgi:hypothetical protein
MNAQMNAQMNASVILDRRRVLAGGGALIVSFSLTEAFAQDQTRHSWTPGFASMLTAALPRSPARPSSARVSRPRSSRSPPKNWMFPSNR